MPARISVTRGVTAGGAVVFLLLVAGAAAGAPVLSNTRSEVGRWVSHDRGTMVRLAPQILWPFVPRTALWQRLSHVRRVLPSQPVLVVGAASPSRQTAT
jgi:hypothetical protein